MNIEDYMLPCMNKKLFGVECFGCGAQRSFLMVVNGDFAGAFHLFPAIYTTILFFGLAILNFIDKKRNYAPFLISLGILNAVLMVVSYFYRHFTH